MYKGKALNVYVLLFLLLLHSKKSVRSDGDGTGNDGNDDNFFLWLLAVDEDDVMLLSMCVYTSMW